jgi:hypothetical protein
MGISTPGIHIRKKNRQKKKKQCIQYMILYKDQQGICSLDMTDSYRGGQTGTDNSSKKDPSRRLFNLSHSFYHGIFQWLQLNHICISVQRNRDSQSLEIKWCHPSKSKKKKLEAHQAFSKIA